MLSVSIRKKLGQFNLNVSFEADNEKLALLGASGCGKSYTLKCIAGIETPDEGRIVMDGRVLFDSEQKINLAPQQRRVGYLFQQFALFPDMTVAQNIASGLRTGNKATRKRMVSEKMKALHLEGLEEKRPCQLSGGQQQRVALARILINEPALLLLDEPFSALDEYLKWQLELELFDTLSEFSGTTVFVSHNRNEVYRLCDSVCVLSDGKSEPKTTVKKLFHNPDTISACLLSGCKNFSKIQKIDDCHVKALDWDAVLKVSEEVLDHISYIGVRAHFLIPVSEKEENTILCQVERVVEDVFSVIVMLRTPAGRDGFSRLRVEMNKKEWANWKEANDVYIAVNPESIMLLGD